MQIHQFLDIADSLIELDSKNNGALNSPPGIEFVERDVFAY
jgi:hypothetical protein